MPNTRVVLVELRDKLGLRTAIETVERADLIEFPGKLCQNDMGDGLDVRLTLFGRRGSLYTGISQYGAEYWRV